MEFEYQYGLSKEEVEYINGLVGYELKDEDGIVIRSKQERIYNILIQSEHPDPDYKRETIELIIYKDHIIKVQYRLTNSGIRFSGIFVPFELKGHEERIVKIIKEIQILEATGRGGGTRLKLL